MVDSDLLHPALSWSIYGTLRFRCLANIRDYDNQLDRWG